MPRTDIARRVYNHTWKLDPIIRSLLDTDFYKLLMLQMIWGLYPEFQATFSLINRTTSVRLADNSFYGRKQIFEPEFMAWLENFRLPEYELRKHDGQYELHFAGPWMYT